MSNNKFRVTLTERDLNDLISGNERDRVIEKIYKSYNRGKRQKYMKKYMQEQKEKRAQNHLLSSKMEFSTHIIDGMVVYKRL